jgi:multiple antibiotic resistance protein
MHINFHSFIHLVFIGFIALFPVVNPIGSAFIVSPFFSKLSHKERVKAVKRIVLYAFSICAFTLFIGRWILELFGLSVPVIQLAGGIMICKIGWEFLSSDKQPETTSTDKTDLKQVALIENKLFYPITFPITTGAGTIAVLFTLSTQGGDTKEFSQYLLNNGALLISIIGICILIFIFFVNANRLINYIGSRNEKIVNRLMAFLIFCVGLQIAVGGITHLIKG